MTGLEDLVPINSVPELLPGKPSVSTIWRWARDGIGGVRLKTVRIGGRRFVSRKALEQFIQGTSEGLACA